MPGQVPNSNFPGSGVSILSAVLPHTLGWRPDQASASRPLQERMEEASDLGYNSAETFQLTECCSQQAISLQKQFC